MDCFAVRGNEIRRYAALRIALAIALVGTLLALPSRATAQPVAVAAASTAAGARQRADAQARELFLAGEEAYDQGRYEDARDAFTRAYALSGRPALLFNLGSVSERLRRDEEALRAYEAYLESLPDAPNRGYVESRISFLRAQIDEEERRREELERARAAWEARERAEAERASSTDRAAEERAETLTAPIEPGARGPRDRGGAEGGSGGGGGAEVYEEWWFWTIVGVAVVGAGAGIAAGVAASGSGGGGGSFGPGGTVVALGAW